MNLLRHLLSKTTITLTLTLFFSVQNIFLVHAAESNFWMERRLAALPAQSPLIPSVQPKEKLHLRSSLAKFNNTVPEWIQSSLSPFATFQQFHLSNQSNAKTVVLMQDAHLHFEAQTNIAGAMEAMGQHQPIVVGLEGAFIDTVDFSWYSAIPYRKEQRIVAEAMMKKHLIDGVEFAAMSYGRDQEGAVTLPFDVVGMESKNEFNANVTALKNAVPLKGKAREELALLKQSISEQKKIHFDNRLREFDEKFTAFQKGNLSIATYLLYLDFIEPATTPNLRQFIEASLIEESLDFKKVERERRQLLRVLVKKLSQDEVNQLLQASRLFRAGQVSYAHYYNHLKDVCQKKGVLFRKYPEMNLYAQYVLKSDGISARSLWQELRHHENEVMQSLAQNEAQEKILAQSKKYFLLKKLSKHELTEDEWHALDKNVDSIWGTFADFYQHATKRNDTMVERFSHKLMKSESSTGLMVAGGFHTDGLLKGLKDKGFSVFVFSPKITKPTQGASTLDFLASDRKPLDEIFQGDGLFIPLERATANPVDARRLRQVNADALQTQFGLSVALPKPDTVAASATGHWFDYIREQVYWFIPVLQMNVILAFGILFKWEVPYFMIALIVMMMISFLVFLLWIQMAEKFTRSHDKEILKKRHLFPDGVVDGQINQNSPLVRKYWTYLGARYYLFGMGSILFTGVFYYGALLFDFLAVEAFIGFVVPRPIVVAIAILVPQLIIMLLHYMSNRHGPFVPLIGYAEFLHREESKLDVQLMGKSMKETTQIFESSFVIKFALELAAVPNAEQTEGYQLVQNAFKRLFRSHKTFRHYYVVKIRELLETQTAYMSRKEIDELNFDATFLIDSLAPFHHVDDRVYRAFRDLAKVNITPDITRKATFALSKKNNLEDIPTQEDDIDRQVSEGLGANAQLDYDTEQLMGALIPVVLPMVSFFIFMIVFFVHGFMGVPAGIGVTLIALVWILTIVMYFFTPRVSRQHQYIFGFIHNLFHYEEALMRYETPYETKSEKYTSIKVPPGTKVPLASPAFAQYLLNSYYHFLIQAGQITNIDKRTVQKLVVRSFARILKNEHWLQWAKDIATKADNVDPYVLMVLKKAIAFRTTYGWMKEPPSTVDDAKQFGVTIQENWSKILNESILFSLPFASGAAMVYTVWALLGILGVQAIGSIFGMFFLFFWVFNFLDPYDYNDLSDFELIGHKAVVARHAAMLPYAGRDRHSFERYLFWVKWFLIAFPFVATPLLGFLFMPHFIGATLGHMILQHILFLLLIFNGFSMAYVAHLVIDRWFKWRGLLPAMPDSDARENKIARYIEKREVVYRLHRHLREIQGTGEIPKDLNQLASWRLLIMKNMQGFDSELKNALHYQTVWAPVVEELIRAARKKYGDNVDKAYVEFLIQKLEQKFPTLLDPQTPKKTGPIQFDAKAVYLERAITYWAKPIFIAGLFLLASLIISAHALLGFEAVFQVRAIVALVLIAVGAKLYSNIQPYNKKLDVSESDGAWMHKSQLPAGFGTDDDGNWFVRYRNPEVWALQTFVRQAITESQRVAFWIMAVGAGVSIFVGLFAVLVMPVFLILGLFIGWWRLRTYQIDLLNLYVRRLHSYEEEFIELAQDNVSKRHAIRKRIREWQSTERDKVDKKLLKAAQSIERQITNGFRNIMTHYVDDFVLNVDEGNKTIQAVVRNSLGRMAQDPYVSRLLATFIVELTERLTVQGGVVRGGQGAYVVRGSSQERWLWRTLIEQIAPYASRDDIIKAKMGDVLKALNRRKTLDLELYGMEFDDAQKVTRNEEIMRLFVPIRQQTEGKIDFINKHMEEDPGVAVSKQRDFQLVRGLSNPAKVFGSLLQNEIYKKYLAGLETPLFFGIGFLLLSTTYGFNIFGLLFLSAHPLFYFLPGGNKNWNNAAVWELTGWKIIVGFLSLVPNPFGLILAVVGMVVITIRHYVLNNRPQDLEEFVLDLHDAENKIEWAGPDDFSTLVQRQLIDFIDTFGFGEVQKDPKKKRYFEIALGRLFSMSSTRRKTIQLVTYWLDSHQYEQQKHYIQIIISELGNFREMDSEVEDLTNRLVSDFGFPENPEWTFLDSDLEDYPNQSEDLRNLNRPFFGRWSSLFADQKNLALLSSSFIAVGLPYVVFTTHLVPAIVGVFPFSVGLVDYILSVFLVLLPLVIALILSIVTMNPARQEPSVGENEFIEAHQRWILLLSSSGDYINDLRKVYRAMGFVTLTTTASFLVLFAFLFYDWSVWLKLFLPIAAFLLGNGIAIFGVHLPINIWFKHDGWLPYSGDTPLANQDKTEIVRILYTHLKSIESADGLPEKIGKQGYWRDVFEKAGQGRLFESSLAIIKLFIREKSVTGMVAWLEKTYPSILAPATNEKKSFLASLAPLFSELGTLFGLSRLKSWFVDPPMVSFAKQLHEAEAHTISGVEVVLGDIARWMDGLKKGEIKGEEKGKIEMMIQLGIQLTHDNVFSFIDAYAYKIDLKSEVAKKLIRHSLQRGAQNKHVRGVLSAMVLQLVVDDKSGVRWKGRGEYEERGTPEERWLWATLVEIVAPYSASDKEVKTIMSAAAKAIDNNMGNDAVLYALEFTRDEHEKFKDKLISEFEPIRAKSTKKIRFIAAHMKKKPAPITTMEQDMVMAKKADRGPYPMDAVVPLLSILIVGLVLYGIFGLEAAASTGMMVFIPMPGWKWISTQPDDGAVDPASVEAGLGSFEPYYEKKGFRLVWLLYPITYPIGTFVWLLYLFFFKFLPFLFFELWVLIVGERTAGELLIDTTFDEQPDRLDNQGAATQWANEPNTIGKTQFQPWTKEDEAAHQQHLLDLAKEIHIYNEPLDGMHRFSSVDARTLDRRFFPMMDRLATRFPSRRITWSPRGLKAADAAKGAKNFKRFDTLDRVLQPTKEVQLPKLILVDMFNDDLTSLIDVLKENPKGTVFINASRADLRVALEKAEAAKVPGIELVRARYNANTHIGYLNDTNVNRNSADITWALQRILTRYDKPAFSGVVIVSQRALKYDRRRLPNRGWVQQLVIELVKLLPVETISIENRTRRSRLVAIMA